jgi:hypothetical protein
VRRRVAELKTKREILRQAAAYFAAVNHRDDLGGGLGEGLTRLAPGLVSVA